MKNLSRIMIYRLFALPCLLFIVACGVSDEVPVSDSGSAIEKAPQSPTKTANQSNSARDKARQAPADKAHNETSKQLLHNPSFELWADGSPKAWRVSPGSIEQVKSEGRLPGNYAVHLTPDPTSGKALLRASVKYDSDLSGKLLTIRTHVKGPKNSTKIILGSKGTGYFAAKYCDSDPDKYVRSDLFVAIPQGVGDRIWMLISTESADGIYLDHLSVRIPSE